MEIEAVKTVLQLGQAGIFLWLFLRLDDRLEKRDAKYDAEIQRIQGQRINDLKWLSKIPTDLDANYRLGPDSTVKA
jgi:hypothetical protein